MVNEFLFCLLVSEAGPFSPPQCGLSPSSPICMIPIFSPITLNPFFFSTPCRAQPLGLFPDPLEFFFTSKSGFPYFFFRSPPIFSPRNFCMALRVLRPPTCRTGLTGSSFYTSFATISRALPYLLAFFRKGTPSAHPTGPYYHLLRSGIFSFIL